MKRLLGKESIMQEDKKIFIHNALLKAEDALQDAALALSHSRLSTVQNRVYYSIFYTVSALGYLTGFTPSKHKELMGWFNKKFVHEEKIFSIKLAKIYKTAFENRMKCDYDIIYKPEKEIIEQNYENAKEFVEIVKTYILKELES